MKVLKFPQLKQPKPDSKPEQLTESEKQVLRDMFDAPL